MLKKTIQILLIIILISILALIFIFVFNPGDLRTKIISRGINSFLENTLDDYDSSDSKDINSQNSEVINSTSEKVDNPLLNDEQEKILENLGVDVSQLPTVISPAMAECFIEKLGATRAEELVEGATPGPLDIFKAKDCLNK
jgi:predicted PurR-regulated permease PerM